MHALMVEKGFEKMNAEKAQEAKHNSEDENETREETLKLLRGKVPSIGDKRKTSEAAVQSFALVEEMKERNKDVAAKKGVNIDVTAGLGNTPEENIDTSESNVPEYSVRNQTMLTACCVVLFALFILKRNTKCITTNKCICSRTRTVRTE
mmetsp:Transcript_9563/g.11829  ORF Transcript_9563/g.11829 Transcript_9563/m.11829 type:complete len:150 (+) Transcript_9563:324-773(+)